MPGLLARPLRLADPLRRDFLDTLRTRAVVPRLLVEERVERGGELALGVLDDPLGPVLVLAALRPDGERRWILRQPLTDTAGGDLFAAYADEYLTDPEDRAEAATAEFFAALEGVLRHFVTLRPEHAGALRGMADVIAGLAEPEPEPELAEVAVEEPEDEEPEDEEPEEEPEPAPAAVRPAAPRRRRRRRPVTPVLGALLTVAGVVGLLGFVASQSPASQGGKQRRRDAPRAATVGDFAFQRVNADGTPVRLDPCRTYEYVVRSGPLDRPVAAAEAGAGMAKLEEATGITFRFAGFTKRRFPYPSGAGSAGPVKPRRVLVSFEHRGESRALQEGTGQQPHSGNLEVGGLSSTTPVTTPSGGNAIGGGAVVVDAGLSPDDRARVLLHELGHLAGLDHARHPSQIMAAVVPRTTTEYQPGDRAGLAAVGARGGCVG